MTIWMAYVIAGILGALVGMVEILQRYRAEPFAAVRNGWGAAYVLFNGGMALCGFFVAVRSAGLGAQTTELELLSWAAAAGFGAAALLRAKLMNIRLSEGKELALGPELLIQTFLSVIDREIDRLRGRKRFVTVRKLFEGVDFEKAKVSLPIQIFQALQTVTEEETQKLMDRVAEVDAMTSLGSRDKAFQLGFYLLDLVGEEFLTDVMNQYGAEFRSDPE